MVPIEAARMEDRQIIEGDKDDIDVLKFMKVDVLCLGMLGCMNRAFNLLAEHKGISVGMADLQDDDPAVYGMIQKAATLGVFQIEIRWEEPTTEPQTLMRTSYAVFSLKKKKMNTSTQV